MKNHSKNKNILIINGHPDKARFCAALAVSRGTLRFCGYGPVRRTFIGSVKRSSEQKRARWLNKIEKPGKCIR